MGMCWWVLVCGAVLGVAGTPTAPAAPTFSGHVAVAPTPSSGVGTQAVDPAPAAATVPGGTHAEPSMNFTLRLLHGDSGAMKKPLVVSSGSVIHLEARVDFGPGVSPRIYMDQCYGTSSGWPGHSRRAYVVVNSQGCLHGPSLGSVSVQHQRGASVLQFSILAPVLEVEPEEEVYVHCLLTAWGAQRHSLRSCFYSEAVARWHNAEDPSQSALCDCCDTRCPPGDTPPGQQPEFPGEGMLHQEMVGPLLVQDLEPWYEAPCRTVKKLLLAGLALLGSAVVAAALVGSVLALGLAVWRLRRGQRRRRRPRRQCPFQAELQAVVGALVPRELEKQGEPGLEYRSLEHSLV
ncbi:zona pellucida sperm-binding protein 3-like isoform X2 [Cygnus olor]|uniref:zona pellucida sperm-binding protein 3-like isoform X2 n=1 Tax=Cygnus olor TaxID=8869 RepID=UPI001ADE7136|nr:zona pellucida sperm-binding protein 3-like isoform X2 [Cygnus olor]